MVDLISLCLYSRGFANQNSKTIDDFLMLRKILHAFVKDYETIIAILAFSLFYLA
jgi:hypothetical protein